MINSIEFKNNKYKFIIPNKVIDGMNVFTVITGKNGVGKSRILSSITRHFIHDNDKAKLHRELVMDFDRAYYDIEYENAPARVIAVSTSAFDKFPIAKRRERIDSYAYLGLRGLSSLNLSSEYLSRIISKLVSSIANKEIDVYRISQVLNYLGYHDEIEISFSVRFSEPKIREILHSRDRYEAFEHIFLRNTPFVNPINRGFFIDDDNQLYRDKVDYALDIMVGALVPRIGTAGSLSINNYGVQIDSPYFEINDDFLFLLESGFVTTKSVILHKKESNERFRISNASSGEQCIVMSILGIASQIQDNSIICIDEPEICLHPEWQERYITILMETFKDFYKCHFIIATHSPQITSKLNSKNCFVLSMQDGKVYNASDFINRSIDFQLATIFKAPGYKNEYLTRTLISYLAELTENESIENSRTIEIEKIIGLKNIIDDSDPVKKLISLAENAIKERKNGL
ncbi:AAA family ATPase [Serratia fonticola]|uniref:AAA family ATPase n=1 Tax=Serratia fonticola TaxID=47917 RepID=UPI001ED8C83D|nr:AAA family ATPase [Serratia fonticola]